MIILVTGGSSGLGESITRSCAQNAGNTVYFTYNLSEAGAKQIIADLPNTIAIKCNFKNENEVDRLKEQIAELNPDVLINNAYSGAFLTTYFHKIPSTDFATEFNQNVMPVIQLTQAAINCFRKKRSGKIITILTSSLLNIPPIGSAIYVANKAYLQQLSKIWAAENSKYNITSNTVSPSFMLTNFTSDMDERLIEQMKDAHPLKKLLTTDEVADTVLYLINTTVQVNGVDIVINAATNIK